MYIYNNKFNKTYNYEKFDNSNQTSFCLVDTSYFKWKLMCIYKLYCIV